LPPASIENYFKDSRLQPYRFYLEKILRMRPHTLTADKEELLAMAGKALQTSPKAFSALNNADFKFDRIKDSKGLEHELTHGLYQLYLRSEDRELRKNAFETLHGKFAEFENTLSELIYGEIQSHVFYARARKYKSSLEAALFPKRIPETVYSSLIGAVRKGLPSLHRYVSLRKKILQIQEIHFYDLYVPLVSHVDMKMDYPKAEELVIESAAPLGPEYQLLLSTGLTREKWVDRYENKNKRSGAYSSGCFDSFPYILMNYRGILKDVFTLAHEAGHSMHSQLSRMHQPYHYSHYPIFVAEVASTFNEELLMHLLLQKATRKEEKLFLINEKLEDIRGTLFRQTMFAEYELRLHEYVEKEIPLTPHLLKETYRSLNKDYFGPETYIDAEIDYEWSRIPHFYYNFYVYQYATGISAALALSEKVLSGDKNAREDYLTFLKKGGSLYPIDLLKIAGVDMSENFAVEATIKKFDSLVSELENLTS
jgi:oligoendopeptidase F